MNRSWVRFPQAAQIRPPGTGWAFLYALLVAPLVFRAPEGPAVGPGCLVCPWAAARPRAVRAASFARRVGLKPGQAPPPPTGAAAWPSGPSSALHTGGAWCGRAVGRVASELIPALPLLNVACCRHYLASPDCVYCAYLHARFISFARNSPGGAS